MTPNFLFRPSPDPKGPGGRTSPFGGGDPTLKKRLGCGDRVTVGAPATVAWASGRVGAWGQVVVWVRTWAMIAPRVRGWVLEVKPEIDVRWNGRVGFGFGVIAQDPPVCNTGLQTGGGWGGRWVIRCHIYSW